MVDGGLQDIEEQISVPSASWMPHTFLSRYDLDNQYPSLESVSGEILEDFVDGEDKLLDFGLSLAKDIQDQMDIHGRTRREKIDAHTGHVANMEEQHKMTTTTTTAELRCEIKGLEEAVKRPCYRISVLLHHHR